MVSQQQQLQIARGARRPLPGAPTRLLALVRAGGLDRRILEGDDPFGSPLLRARAAQLIDRRQRELLAASLHGLTRLARRPRRLAAVAPDAAAVLANEAAMQALAARLEGRGAVRPRGVARVRRLVTDSASPVYRGGVLPLCEQLAAALDELDGRPAPRPTAGPGAAISLRRLGRAAARSRRAGTVAPPPAGMVGSSFALPDGSWAHGRREAA